MDSFPLPTAVTYGAEGVLVAATAVNAVGNVGWTSAQYTPEVAGDGSMIRVERRMGKRLPPGSPLLRVEDGAAPEEQRRFRIEVTDVGLGASATWITARVYTGVEDPHVVPLYRVGQVFRSAPLYLVAERLQGP